ncbi:unnamed protein product [Caenorhabditis angaria]|uniref:Uncharacterized protein n=1 Tax=Caenorhabditis angaria TaxID=860376 RepID=A0A9P1IL61_9PELO|nr:unnamed protein product [Caenorhabditis angaria]
MDVLKNAYEITKNWSNEYVKALVTKLVHRNKITEKFKNSKIEDVQKLLKILFEDESNEMLGYYNSEDNFLMNLWALQMFSNSMLYFDCRLNFEKKSFNVMDMKNVPFLTKHEMIVMFFGRLKRENLPSHRLSDLMGKSTLRKIARSLKESNESHEMIPGMLFDANINQFVEYYISGYPKNLEFVEIHQITRLFDSNCDSDLMLEAVLVIHQETLSCSISEKQDYYSKVYRDLSYWKEVIPKFFEENNWFHEKYPVVQGLYETHKEGDESKFLIAKELENALEIAMRKRYSKPFPKGLISIETEEERKLGILLSTCRCS